MEKSSDKATFSSVMTNSTVMQRIKRLHKDTAGETKKQTNNPKLHENSIKERKIHQETVLQSTPCLVLLLDYKLKAHP